MVSKEGKGSAIKIPWRPVLVFPYLHTSGVQIPGALATYFTEAILDYNEQFSLLLLSVGSGTCCQIMVDRTSRLVYFVL